jgi:hypothetical protein
MPVFTEGTSVAMVAGTFAFTCYWLCTSVLLTHIDTRLTLTFPETFSGLAQIRDIFNGANNYSAQYNPTRLDHVRFSNTPQTLEEKEDLERRGLVVWQPYTLSKVSDSPSLLYRLMLLSWCSSGPPQAGILPAGRTPGCKCIADTYLDFVNVTKPANATNATIVYPSADVRRLYGDRVYRCWDRRMVTRSTSCGRTCTTHVAGLSLFANLILLISCGSFLLFRYVPLNTYIIKAGVVLLSVAAATPYLVQDIGPNTLNLAGILVCLFYIMVTLHKELDLQKEVTSGPNGLAACVIVNLPLILSAHTIQLGVSGYGRDLWAVLSFGICGALMGAILQV